MAEARTRAPYGILLIVQFEIPLTGRLQGNVLLQGFLWGFAEGQLPEDNVMALHAVEAAAWRVVRGLRACGAAEELPYLRVA